MKKGFLSVSFALLCVFISTIGHAYDNGNKITLSIGESEFIEPGYAPTFTFTGWPSQEAFSFDIDIPGNKIRTLFIPKTSKYVKFGKQEFVIIDLSNDTVTLGRIIGAKM